MQPVVRGRVDYLPTYEAMQAFTAGRTEATPDELWLCEHPPVFTQGLAGRPDHVLDAGAIPVIATNRGGQVTYHGPGQIVAYPLLDLQRAGYFIKEYVYRIEEAVIRTLAHFGVTGHRVAGAPGIYVRLDDPFGHSALQRRPVIAGRACPGLDPGMRHPWIPDQVRDDSQGSVRDDSQGSVRDDSQGSVRDDSQGSVRDDSQGSAMDTFAGLGKIAALGIKVSRHCTYHGVAFNVAMDLEPFSRINPCGYPGLKTVDLSTIGVSVTWNEAAQVLGRKLSDHLAP
jgi:lipoyl(octanoyl) transferase